MPIHDVGYRRWKGRLESPWLRWSVIAGAGIRLVWKNQWVRRMLIASWLPAAGLGIVFFVYEQALERPETFGERRIELEPLVPLDEDVDSSTPTISREDTTASREDTTAAAVEAIERFDDLIADGRLDREDVAELQELKNKLEEALRTGTLGPENVFEIQELQQKFVDELQAKAKREAVRQARQRALPAILADIPHSKIARDAWDDDPESSRHAVWSLLLHFFFRYPQGTLMVLLVGMIAPSLVSLDFRSRAFLLYFSRPITPVEYIVGKAMVIICYLAAITTLPAIALYLLGVLLSPDMSVVAHTWDLPFRIVVASIALMIPTTALALFFSSLTTESRYAGFAWFAVWGLGWTAYSILQGVFAGRQWSIVSLYHMLGRVQTWIFGLSTDINDVTSATSFLVIVTVLALMVLVSRVAAPMRI